VLSSAQSIPSSQGIEFFYRKFQIKSDKSNNMESPKPEETKKDGNEQPNSQSVITSAVVIGIILAMVAIIEVGGLQLWEWVQGLEEVAQ
jgi:hypothetical protein